MQRFGIRHRCSNLQGLHRPHSVALESGQYIRACCKGRSKFIGPAPACAVFVEHNVAQCNVMALTVRSPTASVGVFNYARHLGVARKSV